MRCEMRCALIHYILMLRVKVLFYICTTNDRYIMNCNVINCVSCKRVANHQAHVNCN